MRRIKRLLLFVLLIFSLSITSCSKPTYDLQDNSSSFEQIFYNDYSSASIIGFIPNGSHNDYNSSSNVQSSYDDVQSGFPAEEQYSQSSNSVIVYITDTGEKYHLSSCASLWKSSHALTVDEAWNKGYFPCLKCLPPLPDFVLQQYENGDFYE